MFNDHIISAVGWTTSPTSSKPSDEAPAVLDRPSEPPRLVRSSSGTPKVRVDPWHFQVKKKENNCPSKDMMFKKTKGKGCLTVSIWSALCYSLAESAQFPRPQRPFASEDPGHGKSPTMFIRRLKSPMPQPQNLRMPFWLVV